MNEIKNSKKGYDVLVLWEVIVHTETQRTRRKTTTISQRRARRKNLKIKKIRPDICV
ncbi:MAG: hypothetical protein U0586_15210 [Candidatus Brocadiaceae bacterium]